MTGDITELYDAIIQAVFNGIVIYIAFVLFFLKREVKKIKSQLSRKPLNSNSRTAE